VVQGLIGFADPPDDDRELGGWGRPAGAAAADLYTESLARAAVTPPQVDLDVGGGNGIVAMDQAECTGLAASGLGHVLPRSLKGCLGESLGMASAASLAWAADSVERGNATVSLVTNLDFHAQYVAAVATKWAS
jgi:3-oxoacyl-(acyl-carrier-protein) synthase